MTTAIRLIAAVLLVCCYGSVRAEEKSSVREIDQGILSTPTDADVARPVRIRNAEELSKAIPDKEWRARIAKQVDFGKEHVLYFLWSGVSSDQLTYKVEKGAKGRVVVFTYTPGLTDDPTRPRFRIFTIGKEDAVKVEKVSP